MLEFSFARDDVPARLNRAVRVRVRVCAARDARPALHRPGKLSPQAQKLIARDQSELGLSRRRRLANPQRPIPSHCSSGACLIISLLAGPMTRSRRRTKSKAKQTPIGLILAASPPLIIFEIMIMMIRESRSFARGASRPNAQQTNKHEQRLGAAKCQLK